MYVGLTVVLELTKSGIAPYFDVKYYRYLDMVMRVILSFELIYFISQI